MNDLTANSEPVTIDDLARLVADTAPLNDATTQFIFALGATESAKLPGENRRAHLLAALRACHTAMQMFLLHDQVSFARQAAQQLYRISEECGELFPALWAELNVGAVPAWLQGMRMPDALRELFEKFSATRQATEETERGEAWQATAQLAEELLAHPDAARLPYTPDAWHGELANLWNHTGIVHGAEDNYAAARAAFGNAIQHQPDNATLHRNRANANIELGNFDAAEQDLARAEELEPGHARSAELRAEMERKRGADA